MSTEKMFLKVCAHTRVYITHIVPPSPIYSSTPRFNKKQFQKNEKKTLLHEAQMFSYWVNL